MNEPTTVWQLIRQQNGLDQPVDLDRELRLLRRMAAHGGDFTRPLATAWLAADPDNAGKLRAAFGHYLARYEAAPAVESP